MSGYNVFSNLSERTTYPAETKWINTDPSGQFSIIDNELVLENVGITVLNDDLLTVDGSGLVSKLNTAVILPNQDLNTTDSPTFVGLTLTGVPNDDTENRLLVLNTADDQFEYRNVSSLPVVNPFDQDLNRADDVRFNRLDVVNSGTFDRVDITTDGTGTQFTATPASFSGPKEMLFTDATNDNTVKFQFENRSITGGTDAQINLDAVDDAYISFKDDGVSNKFHIGENASFNDFRITHGNTALDSPPALIIETDETVWASTLKIGTVLEDFITSDKLLVWDDRFAIGGGVKYREISTLPVVNPFDQTLNMADPVDFLSVEINNNVLINSANDSITTLTQTPAVTTGNKSYVFNSNTSDSAVRLFLRNENSAATADVAISLQADATACSGAGGNQYVSYDNCLTGGWAVGKQHLADTFRFNYSAVGTSLTNDANTKMFIDTSGNLDIDGTLSLNNANGVIAGVTDSSTAMIQTPAVTTGIKDFIFQSNTTDNVAEIKVLNLGTGAGAHSSLSAETSASGGNLFTKYFLPGTAQWLNGYQTSTGTHRWNYDILGTDLLDTDSNTKMFLDTSGNLDIDGTLSMNSSNIIIDAVSDSTTTFTQTPAVATGVKYFQFVSNTTDSVELLFRNQNAGVIAHSGILLQTDALACSGNGGNEYVVYETCSTGGWTVGRQKSTDTFRWNNVVGASDNLTVDANTKMKLTNAGDLTLTGQLYQQAEVVTLVRTPATTFVIDAITTRYTWTSARGTLAMSSLGQANWTVNAATGIAQLQNYDDAVGTYYVMVNFSCAMRTSAGTDQEINVVCQGAGTTSGFVPSADWGSATQVIKNTADWHNVSFNSLVTIGNTGWFEFTFANLTSSNNIEIKDARATMIK